jgi:hypothetical protein
MSRPSDAAFEEQVLTTELGRRLLEAVGSVAAPRPADIARLRRIAPPDHVAAALRLVEARRRGAAKFAQAGRMWLDPQGVEQATAEAVARHKAKRFGGALVVDLCAGIGGDSLAIAADPGVQVLAVDSDPGMCRRCRWNARVYEVADRIAPIQARAERFGIPPGAQVHIDPDRRAGATSGRRARHLADYTPGLDFLRALPVIAEGGALKLGPASDFAAHFDGPGLEVELVSLEGECKEATVWFGALASCRRRATRLPEGATWTDRDGSGPDADADADAAPVPLVPPQTWIFEPDTALLRAGLLDAFAAVHGLCRCTAGLDYLTASEYVDSPFLAAFAVEEVLPLDMKTLARLVGARQLGPLEIKTRGVDLRPESVRARLRPPGPNPATLLLLGGEGPARAVLARRS